MEVMSSQANGKISTIVAGISTRCHGLNGSRTRRPAAAGATGAAVAAAVMGAAMARTGSEQDGGRPGTGSR